MTETEGIVYVSIVAILAMLLLCWKKIDSIFKSTKVESNDNKNKRKSKKVVTELDINTEN